MVRHHQKKVEVLVIIPLVLCLLPSETQESSDGTFTPGGDIQLPIGKSFTD